MSADVINKVNDYQYKVYADGGPFDVWGDEFDGVFEWYANPSIGSELSRAANIQNRAEAEEFSRLTTWGPFGSAGLAAQWVLDGGWREYVA